MTLRVFSHINEPINQIFFNFIRSMFKIDKKLVPFLCLGSVINFRIIKQIFFEVVITDYNFNFFSLGPLRILITFKNSLEFLVTVYNSLDILGTPQRLSCITLVMWSLRQFPMYPHLCGFRVLVVLNNYG